MHLFRDIKSVYRFITFIKKLVGKEIQQYIVFKTLKTLLYRMLLTCNTQNTTQCIKPTCFFFLIRKTRYTLWWPEPEKYNNSKPYSYRQNVVTISSECEFFRVRLYALAIWGKLRCSGNAKTKEKVDIKQLTWHNSDEAMLGAFNINYTVQLI